MISSLCDILNCLHSCKPPVIHRDIKPSNIIVNSDMKVTLIDFNASKKFDSHKNYDTYLMGTAEYAAPEQFGFSQSDERTDIYALGILLNILITGCFPRDVLCSGAVSKVVTKCTQMEPSQRYSSVIRLKAALKSAVSGASAKKRHPALPPGFRTLTWWKMAVAVIIYPSVIYTCLTLSPDSCTTALQLYTERCLITIWIFFTIALVFNYMNISDSLPVAKSRITAIRALGISLWSLAALLLAAFVSVMIFS